MFALNGWGTHLLLRELGCTGREGQAAEELGLGWDM